MCGISAFLGQKIKIYQYLVETLNVLRSRGYDSAGIASLSDKTFNVFKTIENDLQKLLNEENKNVESCNGISHTRWATHGGISIENTHPFIDYKKRFMLVHNGIIKNSYELKNQLLKEGVTFSGQTDSEVVVNLISYMFDKLEGESFEEVLKQTFAQLEGFWSICILKYDEPNNMYLCNKETPLLIGFTDSAYYISSDFNTFSHKTTNYVEMNMGDILKLEYNQETNKVNKDVLNKYKVIKVDDTVKIALTPYPYEHWLLKEVLGQPESVLRTLNKHNVFDDKFYDIVDNVDNMVIIGSGTSYHAGMMAEYYIRDMTTKNAYCINASEFEMHDIPKNGKTCFIFVSQSGETKDLYDILLKLKKTDNDFKYICITNSYNALIPRRCDFNLYLNLTKEMSVASTKTFTCSVVMMKILAAKIARKEITDFEKLADNIEETLEKNTDIVKRLAKYVENKNMVFLSSSKATIPIVNEINLKFQEICYTYSLCSGAKNLKHGPLALIEKGTPVFFFVPTYEEYKKVKSVANEVKARGGYNILISNFIDYDETVFDELIQIQLNEQFSNLMTLYPLQLMVYYLSVNKGINPDFPRNLAKCVTV